MLHFIQKLYINPIKELPLPVRWLSLVSFINASGMMVLTFLTAYFVTTKGYSTSEAAQFLGAFGTGSLLGAYLGGRLSDTFGGKKILELSLFLGGAGYLLIPIFDSKIGIFLVLLWTGFFDGWFRPANNLEISKWCSAKQLNTAISVHRLAVTTGLSLGAAIGGLLMLKGFSWLCLLDGISCIAAAILLKYNKTFATSSYKLTDAPQAPIINEKIRNQALVLFAILLGIGCVAFIYFQSRSTHASYLVTKYPLSPALYGSLFTIQWLMIISVEIPLTTSISHIRESWRCITGALILGAGYAITPLGSSYNWAVVCMVLATIGGILVFPAAISWVSRIASDKQRGQFLGLHQAVFSLMSILGPVAGASLFEAISAQHFWSFVGFCGFLAASLFAAAFCLEAFFNNVLNNINTNSNYRL